MLGRSEFTLRQGFRLGRKRLYGANAQTAGRPVELFSWSMDRGNVLYDPSRKSGWAAFSAVSAAAPPGAAVAIRYTGGGRGHPESGSDSTGGDSCFFLQKTREGGETHPSFFLEEPKNFYRFFQKPEIQ